MAAAEESTKRKMLVFVAMHEEMGAMLEALGIEKEENKCEYTYEQENLTTLFCCAPRDPTYNVASVGTIPTAIALTEKFASFNPDVVLNAGTSGGFQKRGGEIAKIIACKRTIFHDRRIPLPGYKEYGIMDLTNSINDVVAQELGIETGTLTTADSFSNIPEDLKMFEEYKVTNKDMEGAAVAYCASRKKIPVVFLKGITDIVDHEGDSMADQFLENLKKTTTALAEVVKKFITEVAPTIDLGK